jgi:hypothetical protein
MLGKSNRAAKVRLNFVSLALYALENLSIQDPLGQDPQNLLFHVGNEPSQEAEIIAVDSLGNDGEESLQLIPSAFLQGLFGSALQNGQEF